MSLQLVKTDGTVEAIVFEKVLEDVPGGVTLKTSELKTLTKEILEGALLAEDPSTAKLYHLVKTAKVYEAEAANGTALKVLKAHEFKVGEFITNGQVSTEIVSITTTETLYDTINLTATLDALEAVPVNTIVYQGTSETSNAATASSAVVEDVVDATLTVSSPRGIGNGITVTIAAAGGDTLAVTYTIATRVLLLSLANSTATKNTAALIQAAIRALLVHEGIDFSDWTCAAGGTWDAAAIGGVLTISTDYMIGGVEKPAAIDPLYAADSVMRNSVDVTGDDMNIIVSAVTRGTVNESLLPFYVPACHKTALTDRIKFM